MPLRGGGVGPLMAKNFHFDYLKPSLTSSLRLHKEYICKHSWVFFRYKNIAGYVCLVRIVWKGLSQYRFLWSWCCMLQIKGFPCQVSHQFYILILNHPSWESQQNQTNTPTINSTNKTQQISQQYNCLKLIWRKKTINPPTKRDKPQNNKTLHNKYQ